MKIYKHIFIALACFLAISCGDQLAELNEDPNNSLSGGTGAEVFTSGIAYYGISLEAYFHETDALFAQYWAGGPGVALLDHERFFIEPADFNNEWGYAYLQALSDLKYVKDKGNDALASMADILSVLIYQNLVDHFGNIPYSGALNGALEDGGDLTPVYDDAKAIYDDLVARLDASISVLSDPITEGEVGEEDLIYEGDFEKWIAFANSLKLRILMRQSITGDQTAIGQQVRDLIDEGTFIEGESGLARIPFQGAEGLNYNPMYVRRESGIGQFYVASESSTDVLEELGDPRGLVIYDEAEGPGGLVGLKQGHVNEIPGVKPADFSFPSEVSYGIANDVILMSHWEVMFLRAEAAMRFATSDDEKEMFDAAVTAHFGYIGATGAANYLATEAVYNPAASVQTKSDMIGVQKWISMNGLQESEGWIESRRFDTPPTNVFTNTTSGIFQTPTRSTLPVGVFPTIRLYPQTELSFNEDNTPKGRKTTDKVFWDN